jgi:hypothetical protein
VASSLSLAPLFVSSDVYSVFAGGFNPPVLVFTSMMLRLDCSDVVLCCVVLCCVVLCCVVLCCVALLLLLSGLSARSANEGGDELDLPKLAAILFKNEILSTLHVVCFLCHTAITATEMVKHVVKAVARSKKGMADAVEPFRRVFGSFWLFFGPL